MTQLASIDRDLLHGVSGGFPNGIPNPNQGQPEPRNWTEGLERNLRSRGFDPNINDPGFERKPPNGDMDPGIIKNFDPFRSTTPAIET